MTNFWKFDNLICTFLSDRYDKFQSVGLFVQYLQLLILFLHCQYSKEQFTSDKVILDI